MTVLRGGSMEQTIEALPDPLAVDNEFFLALLKADTETLDRILMDDFLLVEVMQGTEITKPVLLSAVASAQIKFHSIDRAEQRVRFYGSTAVITGSTHMKGSVGDNAFAVHSRYTHVCIWELERWRFVSAQGTPIVPAVETGVSCALPRL
jgi:ketosteroid isomerase-like protein